MQHVYEKHTGCTQAHCAICDGGLAHCTVCGGFEGGLTTECSGRRMSPETQQHVYEGRLDFVGGKWVATSSHDA